MKKSLVKIVAFVLMAVMTVGLSSYYSGTSVRAETAASEQDVEGKRIYFAAPLFNEAEREYNLKLVTLLESYGYEVFLPQRDGFLAPELEGKTEEEKTEMIFRKDRDEVLKADILFMVLDGRVPDEGACVELGIAYANGKRCYKGTDTKGPSLFTFSGKTHSEDTRGAGCTGHNPCRRPGSRQFDPRAGRDCWNL